MPRVAHDVSASAGVEVELRIDADNIELDRRVAAQLVDPIIHLVRNACDHAIEPPDRRAAAGKARTGVVRIHAHRDGRSVIISVRDDGRGIDRTAVIERAIERGIVSPDLDADALDDSDVYELLFLPGFTTMRQTGEYSGHGVGLDVVQQHVVALCGAIEIESTSGVGACFTLRVPDPPLEALPLRR
jgi:two-component system chemotaxis sensor kinase CheA